MTIGPLTELLASALYLLPVAVTLLWWWHRRNSLAEAALWIPAAVAVDILTVLLVAWVIPLDGALLATRSVWLALGVVTVSRRRRSPHQPPAVTGAQLAVIAAAAVAALLLSTKISRPTSIWDRQFHVPLVSMLRGQRLPFLTVFQAKTVLHFHFAGDVISAALQTFSLGRMHSSLALALTHDLMFVLVGISIAAWLVSLAPPRAWMVPGILAVFLHGPLALQREGLGPQLAGYSFLNLYCMSYRPAISLTILLLIGAFAVFGLRLQQPSPPRGWVVAILLACIAVLGIADEPSAAFIGVAMVAVWLANPRLLYANRALGVLVLVAGAAAIIVPNLLFQAALVPGGPVQKVRLVPLRSPGFAEGPLSLSTKAGLYALATDIAPLVLILVAFGATAWRARRAGHQSSLGTGTLTAILGAVLLAATLALTMIDLNGQALENHRFMTICLVLFPLAALLLLARLPPGRWERVLLIGALVIPTVSTWYWAAYGAGEPDDWYTNRVDCRRLAGAGLFDKPRPTYVPRSSFYEFIGCRAAFAPGGANTNDWGGVLLNGYAAGGKGAFEILDRQFVSPRENLRAACPNEPGRSDALCAYARTRTHCVPAGSGFTLCELTPNDRVALKAMAW